MDLLVNDTPPMSKVIRWIAGTNGKVFAVDCAFFLDNRMKQYFPGSGVRRLHVGLRKWGFKRSFGFGLPDGWFAYQHPKFQQKKPWLAETIRVQKNTMALAQNSKNKQRRQAKRRQEEEALAQTNWREHRQTMIRPMMPVPAPSSSPRTLDTRTLDTRTSAPHKERALNIFERLERNQVPIESVPRRSEESSIEPNGQVPSLVASPISNSSGSGSTSLTNSSAADFASARTNIEHLRRDVIRQRLAESIAEENRIKLLLAQQMQKERESDLLMRNRERANALQDHQVSLLGIAPDLESRIMQQALLALEPVGEPARKRPRVSYVTESAAAVVSPIGRSSADTEEALRRKRIADALSGRPSAREEQNQKKQDAPATSWSYWRD
jgi:hypothetical protein